jgi:hypothetical protein
MKHFFSTILIAGCITACSPAAENEGGAFKATNAKSKPNKITKSTAVKPASTVYQFKNYFNLPPAVMSLFGPDAKSDAGYVKYIRDADRGFFELNNGQFSKAIKTFQSIENETLFETENIATWGGHSAALCRSGQKSVGIQKLANAQCSYLLMTRAQTCSDLDIEKKNSTNAQDFPSQCYAQMCEAEIIRPDYDVGSSIEPDTKRLLAYADYLAEVDRDCAN